MERIIEEEDKGGDIVNELGWNIGETLHMECRLRIDSTPAKWQDLTHSALPEDENHPSQKMWVGSAPS